jgi:hypothetical protein
MKYVILFVLFVTVILSGCEDRYRYHCQDPKHWEDEDCKHPICEAKQNCTDYLIHREPKQ